MANPAEKCHVLVVDDDVSVITVVSEILETAGYVVHTATSGEVALEVFATNKVDLILTDICMEHMDGFELMQRLRLVDKDTKVIVMTGHDSYDSVLKALQGGAYDYLQKPLNNHATLLAAVDRAASSAMLQNENTNLLLQLENSHEKLAKANRRLVDANHKLKRLAATDVLTLLFNRRYFDQVIKREIGRRNRYKLALSMIMLDIDHFKQINDKYGHEAGDIAIKQVATILTECARTSDIVSRYGGEEFVVVLPQTDPISAKIFAERARTAIEQHNFEIADDVTIKLTISLGISGVDYSDGETSVQHMTKAADKALYKAKHLGRNCSVIASEMDDDQALDAAA